MLGEFLIWDSRVLAFCRMSTASYMQDATLINFAKTPLMVSREYSNCTWLIAPPPIYPPCSRSHPSWSWQPCTIPPKRALRAAHSPLSDQMVPATSVRVCHCLLSKWIFIWNEKHKQTNKPKDKQKKRTGHDCQQHGARNIALLPIIWISSPAPWMYLVDELSESTIAYQTEMNAIYQSCVFALLPIEFDPARFFLLPLCNFSQGGNLAQHPCF